MTSGQPGATESLILRGLDGGYYAIPRAVVEDYRVPEERTAELEEILAEDRAIELDEEVLGPDGTNFAARESELVFRGWHAWDSGGTS